MQQTTSRLKTSELSLASYLHALGIEITRLDRTASPKRVFFIFNLTDEQMNMVEQYDSDQAMINPKRYYSSIQALKHKIWDGDSH